MNNRGQVVITDFGIVRTPQSVEETRSGVFIGTPQYMAPEQASQKPLDARTDIYALGIVFYQLLAGKVPFDSTNPFEIVMAHLNKPLPDPRELVPGISERVVHILQRMTAKNPQDRYISSRELLWDLESLESKDLTGGTVSMVADMEAEEHQTPTGSDSEEIQDSTPREVSNPIAPAVIEDIQFQLAKFIGPIAGIVLKKEIKKMGFSKDFFPSERVLELVEQLANQVEQAKRKEFFEKTQDQIFERRRKK
jgi:serine/threonine protein kinase